MLDDSGTTPIESPLPPAILRGLGDRSYEKRKQCALEITGLIKTLQDSTQDEKDRISIVISLLANDFTKSRNIHHRKGGLIGLAACAIGLVQDVDKYLHILIPPVLDCFDDPESRVSYYACESLYNISKVARTSILRYFNQIFDGLCKLFGHVDVDVKNGANLLDRLIKDIVTETDTFDIESFVPLLQKHIKRTKPYIRQLIVGWITVLDAVPDISMLDYLPDFLDGLFNMLSDGNREIKQSADNALNEFLKAIKETEIVEFGPLVRILVVQCRSKEKSTRLTAVIWLTEFIRLGGNKLLYFYAGILSSVIVCISDVDEDIRQQAKIADQDLMNLVKTTSEPFDLNPLLHTLTIEILSEHVTTRIAALRWLLNLHEKDHEEINKSVGDLLPALLKAISDSSDDVCIMNLQVIARISIDKIQFRKVIEALVHLFEVDRPLLEARGALVIRKLCALLDPSAIYISLASILNDNPDLEYVGLMVQTLNLILLTAPELNPLRISLRDSFNLVSSSNRDVFCALFMCWAHNPVATFSLCLLSQAYDLSATLILSFAELDVSVGFLLQIDKLVQLLESPLFIRLRLQLLDANTKNHADLLRSLYGLLMLLPQSQAYKTLSDRLQACMSLRMHVGLASSSVLVGPRSEDITTSYEDLLERFKSVQNTHAKLRYKILKDKGMLPPSSALP